MRFIGKGYKLKLVKKVEGTKFTETSLKLPKLLSQWSLVVLNSSGNKL
jgi:hypothetical protein